MKNAAVLAIAGLVAASISSAAYAQVGIGAGASVGAGADTSVGANVAAGATASAGANQAGAPNYGQVIASLRASGDVSAQIETLDATATVRIIALSELRGEAAENAQALEQTLAQMKDRVDEIRSAIDANATLSAALEAEGYTADDVVAVTTAASGEATLIVDG